MGWTVSGRRRKPKSDNSRTRDSRSKRERLKFAFFCEILLREKTMLSVDVEYF